MHRLFRSTKDDDPIEVRRSPGPSEVFIGWFDKPARTIEEAEQHVVAALKI